MKIAFLLACTICGYTFAQPPEEKARDLAYCQALAMKYRTYVESQDARRPAPNADAEIAIDRCNGGDTRGIRTLAHVLERAKIELPPRK
jgi:hypothetical protein